MTSPPCPKESEPSFILMPVTDATVLAGTPPPPVLQPGAVGLAHGSTPFAPHAEMLTARASATRPPMRAFMTPLLALALLFLIFDIPAGLRDIKVAIPRLLYLYYTTKMLKKSTPRETLFYGPPRPPVENRARRN